MLTAVAETGTARGWLRAWWLAAAYVMLAAGTSALILARPVTDRLADLHVYWGAAQAVLHGQPLYGFAAENGDPFTYPPFAMLVFLPLGLVPELVVGMMWTLATFAAFVVLARLVVTRWPQHRPENRKALVWACAIGILLSAPGQSNVRFGQVSVFVVLLALADAVGAIPPRWRGVLVGVAAAVKLTPLLFVVYFLLAGRRREAIRAGAAFAGCATVAGVLMPGASWTYWTSALFSTSRIGDLAALGNQSVNGILLRSGIPGGWRPLVWGLALVVLCVVALWRARDLHRAGLEVHAAVLVGCATVAVSPVSWTHHQFWTVLAAMLLVAGPASVHKVAGWIVLASMTVNLADVVARLRFGDYALFIAANMRGLAAACLCVLGFGALTQARGNRRAARVLVAAAVELVSRGRLVPPRWVLARVAMVGVLFALMPLPRDVDPRVSPATQAEALHVALQTEICQMDASEKLVCGHTPQFVGEPLNYGLGCCDGGVWRVDGAAQADVGRLEYVATPGSAPVDIPLAPLEGVQVFSFTVVDAAYAQLRVYDRSGKLLGDFGRKMRNETAG